jgi:hypothetical protein
VHQRAGTLTTRTLTQWAPWPDALEAAVAEFRYLDGWSFRLFEGPRDYAPDDHGRSNAIAGGLTFEIFVPCHDSYHPERYRPVVHWHPVPAATYSRDSWEAWIFARLLDTLTHEAGEWARFEIEGEFVKRDGEISHVHTRRPFAPLHGPGDDPYVVHFPASDLQRRTSFTGVVNEQTPDHA